MREALKRRIHQKIDINLRNKFSATLRKVEWFKVLLYTSIIFLVATLHQANYLKIPSIYSFTHLAFSIFFLLTGMLLMCNNWRLMLKLSGLPTFSYSISLAANGLSIFTKYIPGKFMVILGRALYTVNFYNISKAYASTLSFKTQLISVWAGLIVSIPLLFFIHIPLEYLIIAIIFVCSVTMALYSSIIKSIILFLPRFISKRKIDYPLLTTKDTLRVLPNFISTWLSWSFGLWFLCSALLSYEISFFAGLTFALAATLGILILVAPGGIGVREGIMTFCLFSFTQSKADAIMIATASRLWFLMGEIFLFTLAIIVDRKIQREKCRSKTNDSAKLSKNRLQ